MTMAAMVLCAGFGTRLRPLTDELPKPLVPVGDRSILAHAVEGLRRGGIHRVVINTHYQAAHFGTLDGQIEVVHEARILGTAGGVAHARAALGEGPIVIWNGDICAPTLDVRALGARRASPSGPSWPSQVAGTSVAEAPWSWVVEPLPAFAGTVGIGAHGEIVRLRGERWGSEISGGNYLGVQVMPESVRDRLPNEGCLVADVALPYLRAGGSIAAIAFGDPWDDVGDPPGLLRANLRWLAARGLSSWCGEQATVASGVRLERAIVGPGAHVTGEGVLRDVVVFAGAHVRAPQTRQLVGKTSQVAVSGAA